MSGTAAQPIHSAGYTIKWAGKGLAAISSTAASITESNRTKSVDLKMQPELQITITRKVQ